MATIAAFMAAAASPPRQERLLYRHLLPAIPLVFLTVLAVAAFRAVWLGDLAWHTHFAALAPASAWTVGLVTLVYWGAARASIDATARAKRRSAIPHPPATLAERFTVTLWWCISTVVCVWAPTLALFQVFEYGFGWQGQHENLITFLLVGVSTSLVFTLGMMGILPGSNRRID
ncbi:MAG: DUF4175 domain-containing protein [Akkermansiaceae bacterium]|nr:DUF4175 domain-containing protein [Akkermansiaceae bacterium]